MAINARHVPKPKIGLLPPADCGMFRLYHACWIGPVISISAIFYHEIHDANTKLVNDFISCRFFCLKIPLELASKIHTWTSWKKHPIHPSREPRLPYLRYGIGIEHNNRWRWHHPAKGTMLLSLRFPLCRPTAVMAEANDGGDEPMSPDF